jgi:hypothetical protein
MVISSQFASGSFTDSYDVLNDTVSPIPQKEETVI